MSEAAWQMAIEDVFRELIVNGDASQGMTGWTIESSPGNGWSTEDGPGESCPETAGKTNFVSSFGWAKKSQLIDLVAAGFDPNYLDTAPRIYVSDWVCGRCDAPSSYELRVELRDAQGNVIKSLVTNELDTPRAGGWTYPWRRILRDFHRYGPGVRFIYFEHGGTDRVNWSGWYGAKMTGASVKVATAPSHHRNLLQNPDGANGMTGWTVLSSGGNGWSTENVAWSCPSSAGQSNFVTSWGWSRKQQIVDLVAAGFTAEQLDQSPDIRIEDWMCGRSDSGSKYYLTVNLLDVNHTVIESFTTGEVSTPLLPNYAYPFSRVGTTFIDYPTGVRFVSFEHGGVDTNGWQGWYGAKMTGAYVGVVLPPPHSMLPMVGADVPSTITVVDNRVRVSPTDVMPTKWICDLVIEYQSGRYSGSGWLVATPGPFAVVVTAGHNAFDKKLGFPKSITVYPARDGSVQPYASYTARANSIQANIRYLVDANGGVIKYPLHDLGAVIVPKSAVDWGGTGFTATVATDDELRTTSLTVAGYPGDKTNPDGSPSHTMWTANGPIDSFSRTSFWYPAIYTWPGNSGSPVYKVGTQQVLGVHVQGLPEPSAIVGSPFGGKATRITAEVASTIVAWATPLTADTRITSLELIVQTGDDFGAGTNDTINVKLAGKDFGNPDDTFFKDRSERDQIDGYDLTDKMNLLFPNGLFVRDLVGSQYTIARVFEMLSGWGYWFYGDWEVHSVFLYVNGQRFHARRYNQWLDVVKPALVGRITETP
ncbi:hypothetical protein [Rhizobium sp. FY34]|uniref:hypothetical protein n=1 Tax=Rhizobium sp. FY34 TaxID=2562309 RepID=UPI0010C0DFC1|nr:hypothetical protein [Rhizobium sp. FY34]